MGMNLNATELKLSSDDRQETVERVYEYPSMKSRGAASTSETNTRVLVGGTDRFQEILLDEIALKEFHT